MIRSSITRLSIKGLFLPAVTLCLFCAELHGAEKSDGWDHNWPQWRGPRANGVAPFGDPPVRWDEETNIRWKAELPGRGSASPIVWEDQVFVLTSVDTGREPDTPPVFPDKPPGKRKTRHPDTLHPFVVMSLDRATGRILWQQVVIEAVPHEGHHPDHGYASASPVTDGRYLFTSFGSRGIFCLDLQVIVNATGKVTSYNLADGKIIWQCGGQTVNAIPSPVSDGDRVFCMSGYRGHALYAIPLDAKGDLTDTDRIVWRHDRGTPYVSSPLLYDSLLYFTRSNSASLSCLDAATGKPHLEGASLPGLKGVYASPVGAAGRIYFVGRNGTALVMNNKPGLEILATNSLDDQFDASPAIAGSALFLRGKKHLYCIAASPAGKLPNR